MLRAHQQTQLEERAISAEGWNADDLVFCSENGTPINQGNLTRQLNALLRRAGLPDIRFHDLRHTYAALSIAAGLTSTHCRAAWAIARSASPPTATVTCIRGISRTVSRSIGCCGGLEVELHPELHPVDQNDKCGKSPMGDLPHSNAGALGVTRTSDTRFRN